MLPLLLLISINALRKHRPSGRLYGCMHPFIFEGALSPVFAEFADRGKFSIELQQESAAFGGHPLSGFAGLPPIQGAE